MSDLFEVDYFPLFFFSFEDRGCYENIRQGPLRPPIGLGGQIRKEIRNCLRKLFMRIDLF